MNVTTMFENSEFALNFMKAANVGLHSLFLISVVLYLFVFPFYVYVFKLNKRRDKKVSCKAIC